MKQILMAIYDHVSKTYSQPFFVINKAVGLRSFMAAANDPQQVIGKNPGDFTAFFIGTYDDETGELTRIEPYESGGLASAYVKDFGRKDYTSEPRPWTNGSDDVPQLPLTKGKAS